MADPPYLRRAERERCGLRAEDHVDEARGRGERPARVPLRVPEQQRHAQELCGRCGQHGEERHHVHEHRVRSRATCQLRDDALREGESAPHACGRAEDPDAHIGRKLVPACIRAQHHHLVEPPRECPHEIERVREHRVILVDRLRHEDQPHDAVTGRRCDPRCGRRARGTRPRIRRRRMPLRVPRVSGFSEPLRERRLARATRTSASTSASLVGGRDQDSLDAVADEVGNPARVGRDHPAAARERLDHDPAQAPRARTAERAASPRRTRARRLRGSSCVHVLDAARGARARAPRSPPGASPCRRSRASPRAADRRRVARPQRARRRSCRARACRRRARSDVPAARAAARR